MLEKLEAIHALGARHFGLFFDDVPEPLTDAGDRAAFSSLADAQTSLIRRLHQRFQNGDEWVHFFICLTVYAGDGDSDSLRHLGEHLPAGVDVFWTGPAICSERVSSDAAAGVAQALGRPPVLWDNYPVNDGVMSAELHMAPCLGRADDLHRAVRGVFANPMTLPEASKVPLACVGAYAWNPRRYRANAVWDEAIKQVAGPAAAAFQRFCACNPMSILYEEPGVLLHAVETFKRDFWAGDFAGAIDRIEAFFDVLDRDIGSISEALPNPMLLAEIRPWLDDMRRWCVIGGAAARAYRAAVEVLAAKGQHPAVAGITIREREAASTVPRRSDEIDADEVEHALTEALERSVRMRTKAGGYVIRDFAFEARDTAVVEVLEESMMVDGIELGASGCRHGSRHPDRPIGFKIVVREPLLRCPTMSTRIDAPTLAQHAYRTLRRLILSSELEPGSRLVVRVLSERYGLSPTPFKEALVALEREGLVSSQPRRGYSVATIDPESIRQRYQVREVLEGLAARLAAERMTPEVLGQLETVYAEQRARLCASDLEGSGDSDLDFHRMLWRASGNEALVQTAETFTGQVRLLMSSTRAKVPGRHAEALAEHGQLIERLRAGDADGAEAIMKRHVRAAGQALHDHLTADRAGST